MLLFLIKNNRLRIRYWNNVCVKYDWLIFIFFSFQSSFGIDTWYLDQPGSKISISPRRFVYYVEGADVLMLPQPVLEWTDISNTFSKTTLERNDIVSFIRLAKGDNDCQREYVYTENEFTRLVCYRKWVHTLRLLTAKFASTVCIFFLAKIGTMGWHYVLLLKQQLHLGWLTFLLVWW